MKNKDIAKQMVESFQGIIGAVRLSTGEFDKFKSDVAELDIKEDEKYLAEAFNDGVPPDSRFEIVDFDLEIVEIYANKTIMGFSHVTILQKGETGGEENVGEVSIVKQSSKDKWELVS